MQRVQISFFVFLIGWVSAALSVSAPVRAEECGQACFYQRANEVLMLEAKYLLKKVEKLRPKVLTRSGSVVVGTVNGALGDFCKAQSRDGDDSRLDNEAECWRSYLLVTKRSIAEIRRAMAQNYDAASRLGTEQLVNFKPGEPSDGGELTVSASPDSAAMSMNAPLLPELSALDPLLQRFDQMWRRGQSGTGAEQVAADRELRRWWDRYPRCPSKDEFVEVEQVERYPSHPTGEKITRIKTDGDGKVVLDTKRFQMAESECQRERAEWVKRSPLADAGSPAAKELPTRLKRDPGKDARAAFAEAQKELSALAKGKASPSSSLSGGSSGLQAGQAASAGPKKEFLFLPDSEFEKADKLLEQWVAEIK